MKKFLYIVALLFISSNNVNAQGTDWASYFPLKIGNAWYYKTTYYLLFPPTYSRDYIERDTAIGGIKYFRLNHQRYGASWVRIDSVKGNFLRYSQNSGCGSYPNDKIIDSLTSNINSQIYCNNTSRRYIDTGSITLFGNSKKYKEFRWDNLLFGTVMYVKNFGVYNACAGEPPPTCYETTFLMGCRIDGVVYGDTNLVDIEKTSSKIPNGFFLYQNFPNPFNPATIIRYDIPFENKELQPLVLLNVYDVLGNKVVTLVDEKLSDGSYSIEFNGANYPSGIYYYKLVVEDFSEVKKMILVK